MQMKCPNERMNARSGLWILMTVLKSSFYANIKILYMKNPVTAAFRKSNIIYASHTLCSYQVMYTSSAGA